MRLYLTYIYSVHRYNADDIQCLVLLDYWAQILYVMTAFRLKLLDWGRGRGRGVIAVFIIPREETK